jgi:hypothetical protein
MKLLLENIIELSDKLPQLKKSEVYPGDLLFVRTKNSTYKIKVGNNGYYFVSGGWFEKNKLSEVRTKITGCTWGGSAIKTDVVAVCGLYLEFGNKLKTSRIRKIFVLPGCYFN